MPGVTLRSQLVGEPPSLPGISQTEVQPSRRLLSPTLSASGRGHLEEQGGALQGSCHITPSLGVGFVTVNTHSAQPGVGG